MLIWIFEKFLLNYDFDKNVLKEDFQYHTKLKYKSKLLAKLVVLI